MGAHGADMGQELTAKGQARVEGTGSQGPVAVARPHLHRAVAQLDGLVDTLHDLVETCREQEKQCRNLSLPCTPSHP